MAEDMTRLSITLSRILRHRPDEIGEPREVMDIHGWVSVKTLISGVNRMGKYKLDIATLEKIVAEDKKGRYRFNEDKSKIKCCQGHTIPWVVPELTYKAPPEYLYHGTTTSALQKIMDSGRISKMKRHAVHMQPDMERARQSAERWHLTPVILKIAARRLYDSGVSFGVTENEVWCAEEIPKEYIAEILYI